MKWFNRLERKLGKYAISNLMYYIIGIYVVGFVINLFAPEFYMQHLALSVEKILQGQVWRLVTFIVYPPSGSFIFMAFTLYFYYLIGTNLENIWGKFKFNLYFFSGVLFQILAAFLIYFIFGVDYTMMTYYLNLALFMAFAMEYGNTVVYLFFILPIKIKWLAYLDGAVLILTIVCGYLAYPIAAYLPGLYMGLAYAGIPAHPVFATSALVSMINFAIFFFVLKKGPAKSKTQKNYQKAFKTAEKAAKNHQQEQSNGRMVSFGAKHRCAVCGRTENDGDLTFRFCSKCQGNYEYCQDHLYTHIHVGSNGPGNN